MDGDEKNEPLDIAEYVEDKEVLKVLQQPLEVSDAILEAKSLIVDHAAIGTIRQLMQSSDSDAVKLQAVQTWLGNRTKLREIQSRKGDSGATFNFNFAADKEVSNVKETRRAFGLDSAEDAEVIPDEHK